MNKKHVMDNVARTSRAPYMYRFIERPFEDEALIVEFRHCFATNKLDAVVRQRIPSQTPGYSHSELFLCSIEGALPANADLHTAWDLANDIANAEA